MKTATLSLSLVAFLVTAAGACGGARLLVGNTPDSGTAGSTGSAGATGGGTAGAAGTGITRIVTPLGIPGEAAIERIAQVLWHEAPDADLMMQATQGHFTTTSDLYPAIHQMLADPRAKVGVGAFYRWWLNLDAVATTVKDPLLFPTYTPELQADMANETETFGVDATLARNASYQYLMTASDTFINARLADIYLIPGVAGDELRPSGLDFAVRAGILTQPALQVLASQSTRTDPTRRGVNIEQRILCQITPPEPLGTSTAFVLGGPGITMRDALAANLAGNSTCAVCHRYLDPPGLAFEAFDPIGRFRTTDNGAVVDVSGLKLFNTVVSGDTVTVNGPVELAYAISQSDNAERCMTKQWFAFVLGKTFADINDAMVDEAHPTFVSSNFNLKELIVAVLTSPSFLAPIPLP